MAGNAAQRRAVLAASVMIIAGLFFTGCAAHRIKTADDAASSDWLSDYMSKVRVLQSEARPAPVTPSATRVEASDPSLAGALADVNATPTAAGHIEAAEELRRLGILEIGRAHV